MGCKGLHCDGCSHGGGGPAVAVIALLVIIAVAARSAWPRIVSAVEVAAWTVAAVSGAVIAVTGGVLTVRVIRARRARRAMRQVTAGAVRPAGHRVIPGTLAAPPIETPGQRRAIDEPRRRAASWPLAGRWEEIRPPVGGDGDDRRPR